MLRSGGGGSPRDCDEFNTLEHKGGVLIPTLCFILLASMILG